MVLAFMFGPIELLILDGAALVLEIAVGLVVTTMVTKNNRSNGQ